MRDLERVARYELVYVFMWVTPVGASVFERIVRRLARLAIYDGGDDGIRTSE